MCPLLPNQVVTCLGRACTDVLRSRCLNLGPPGGRLSFRCTRTQPNRGAGAQTVLGPSEQRLQAAHRQGPRQTGSAAPKTDGTLCKELHKHSLTPTACHPRSWLGTEIRKACQGAGPQPTGMEAGISVLLVHSRSISWVTGTEQALGQVVWIQRWTRPRPRPCPH